MSDSILPSTTPTPPFFKILKKQKNLLGRHAGCDRRGGKRAMLCATFQGFLQGLYEASPAMAVTVILAQVLTPWEGQGRQVKVHQRQVMTSYLGKMKQSARQSEMLLLRASVSSSPHAASRTLAVVKLQKKMSVRENPQAESQMLAITCS